MSWQPHWHRQMQQEHRRGERLWRVRVREFASGTTRSSPPAVSRLVLVLSFHRSCTSTHVYVVLEASRSRPSRSCTTGATRCWGRRRRRRRRHRRRVPAGSAPPLPPPPAASRPRLRRVNAAKRGEARRHTKSSIGRRLRRELGTGQIDLCSPSQRGPRVEPLASGPPLDAFFRAAHDWQPLLASNVDNPPLPEN